MQLLCGCSRTNQLPAVVHSALPKGLRMQLSHAQCLQMYQFGAACPTAPSDAQWLALAPKETQSVEPIGQSLDWVDPSLPPAAADELRW